MPWGPEVLVSKQGCYRGVLTLPEQGVQETRLDPRAEPRPEVGAEKRHWRDRANGTRAQHNVPGFWPHGGPGVLGDPTGRGPAREVTGVKLTATSLGGRVNMTPRNKGTWHPIPESRIKFTPTMATATTPGIFPWEVGRWILGAQVYCLTSTHAKFSLRHIKAAS